MEDSIKNYKTTLEILTLINADFVNNLNFIGISKHTHQREALKDQLKKVQNLITAVEEDAAKVQNNTLKEALELTKDTLDDIATNIKKFNAQTRWQKIKDVLSMFFSWVGTSKLDNSQKMLENCIKEGAEKIHKSLTSAMQIYADQQNLQVDANSAKSITEIVNSSVIEVITSKNPQHSAEILQNAVAKIESQNQKIKNDNSLDKDKKRETLELSNTQTTTVVTGAIRGFAEAQGALDLHKDPKSLAKITEDQVNVGQEMEKRFAGIGKNEEENIKPSSIKKQVIEEGRKLNKRGIEQCGSDQDQTYPPSKKAKTDEKSIGG